MRVIAGLYTVFLAAVSALNYIPGVVDAGGLVLGIFALDVYDDALHLASALWAAAAALTSRRAARLFLLIFGWIYLLDGVSGLLFGSGYLDLAILTQGIRDYPWTFKLLANEPHIALCGLGVIAASVGRRPTESTAST